MEAGVSRSDKNWGGLKIFWKIFLKVFRKFSIIGGVTPNFHKFFKNFLKIFQKKHKIFNHSGGVTPVPPGRDTPVPNVKEIQYLP
jgi:hypothetical protein